MTNTAEDDIRCRLLLLNTVGHIAGQLRRWPWWTCFCQLIARQQKGKQISGFLYVKFDKCNNYTRIQQSVCRPHKTDSRSTPDLNLLAAVQVVVVISSWRAATDSQSSQVHQLIWESLVINCPVSRLSMIATTRCGGSSLAPPSGGDCVTAAACRSVARNLITIRRRLNTIFKHQECVNQ